MTQMVSAMILCLQPKGQSQQYYQLKKEHDKRNDGDIVEGQSTSIGSISKYRYDKNPCT